MLHGGVNRAILSYALTGERMFLGHFEQAPACVNVLDLGDAGEWIVRAVNVAPYDLLHLSHRQTTMERYWEQYRSRDETRVEAGFPASTQSHAEKRLARASLDQLAEGHEQLRRRVETLELHLADDVVVRLRRLHALMPGSRNLFVVSRLVSALIRPARVGFFPAL